MAIEEPPEPGLLVGLHAGASARAASSLSLAGGPRRITTAQP
jgi:hypothetical protein